MTTAAGMIRLNMPQATVPAAPHCRPGDDRRTADAIAAALLWLLSGSSVMSNITFSFYATIGGPALFVAYIAFRGRWHPKRLVPFVLLGLAFVGWAILTLPAFGDFSQFFPLAGHLLKIAAAALFVAACDRPGEALVRSMVWFALIALIVFSLRQIGLSTVSYDIADLFDWFYPILDIPPDRSIVFFNFDIASQVTRNSGPFREAGLFAASLVIALLILISVSQTIGNNKLVARYMGILILALLSTQSTMGLAAAPFVLVLWLLTNRSMSRVSVLAMVLGATALGSAIWFAGGQSDKVLWQNLAFQERIGSWEMTRVGNAYVDWVAITERPITGYGFTEHERPILWNEQERPILWAGEDKRGFGNGLSGTVVKFGIPFALLIYAFFVVRLRQIYDGLFATYIAVVVLAMLLIGQQLLTMPLLFVLVGSLGPEKMRLIPRRRIAPPFRRDVERR